MRTLEESEVDLFRRTGFLLTRTAFDQDKVDEMKTWVAELASRPEESGRHWVYHETSRFDGQTLLINRIENMVPYHPGIAALCEAVCGPVGQLLGEEAVLFKEKINFKLPGGEGFEPHQDSQAGWETYAPYFISVLVAIDDATLENGCLKVAPRNSENLVGSEWTPLNEQQTKSMNFEPVPMNGGDVLYFDSYVPHASDPNQSNLPRRLFYATYNRRSDGDHRSQYYADKHKSFPPDIDRDPDKDYVYRV